MDEIKPFKGNLYSWKKSYFNIEEVKQLYQEDGGLGYIIVGYTTEPPKLGSYRHTSWVVKHHEDGLVETRNSIYKLVGPERT